MVMKNINDYLQYDVTTKFETIIQDEITFPSLTICIKSHENIEVTKCEFNSNYDCLYDYEQIMFLDRNCILLNNGKNISNHSVALLKSKEIGYYNGIKLSLEVRHNQWVSIYVGEPLNPPTIYQIQSVDLAICVTWVYLKSVK